jgi:tRNA pseudouridine13 synthase
VDGSKATVQKAEATKPALGASMERQRFLLCVMVKRDWDTFIAVKNVAKALGIDQARVSFAGIKDAKAITAQHITIEDVTFEQVSAVQVRDVELRPAGYFREQLAPFYLLGNSFTIRVKAISKHEAEVKTQIAETMTELTLAGGMPNFYGHQRFGTTRPITHLVGKALMQGDLERAVMTFLAEPSPYEHPQSSRARQELRESRNFGVALESFPQQLRYERAMIGHLADNPSDYAGAFRCLPLKLRLLFLQAYQSYLFNRFLSARIRSGTSINRAEPGDWVVNVERNGLPMPKTGRLAEQDKLALVNAAICAGKMRIALPVVGFSQRLSQGEAGEQQHRILEQEGVNLSGFRVAGLPEVSSRGELRAVVCPIKDFTSSINSTNSEKETAFAFTLLKSAYATVLLREIMKPPDLVAAGF